MLQLLEPNSVTFAYLQITLWHAAKYYFSAAVFEGSRIGDPCSLQLKLADNVSLFSMIVMGVCRMLKFCFCQQIQISRVHNLSLPECMRMPPLELTHLTQILRRLESHSRLQIEQKVREGPESWLKRLHNFRHSIFHGKNVRSTNKLRPGMLVRCLHTSAGLRAGSEGEVQHVEDNRVRVKWNWSPEKGCDAPSVSKCTTDQLHAYVKPVSVLLL